MSTKKQFRITIGNQCPIYESEDGENMKKIQKLYPVVTDDLMKAGVISIELKFKNGSAIIQELTPDNTKYYEMMFEDKPYKNLPEWEFTVVSVWMMRPEAKAIVDSGDTYNWEAGWIREMKLEA